MARRHNARTAPFASPLTSGLARTGLWLGLALLGLTLLAYFPSLSCGFIWDDDAYLTQNPSIVGPPGFADIWTSACARICPLAQSTFWLEYRLLGLEPMPHHLVNILFHGATAVVLWRVLRILGVPGAWLGAALWALHPVQVESVAWITEMKNTQSGLFFRRAARGHGTAVGSDRALSGGDAPDARFGRGALQPCHRALEIAGPRGRGHRPLPGAAASATRFRRGALQPRACTRPAAVSSKPSPASLLLSTDRMR